MEITSSATIADATFLGITWNMWKVIGWTGNAVFFSRFIIQWIATERRKQVVMPSAFWWLSLVGTFLLLSYAALYKRDSVLTFGYCFAWIPYVRNLIIHRRHKHALLDCPDCGAACPPNANYCFDCGTPLTPDAPTQKAKTPSR